ncbi:hypothetical protein LTY04_001643 [Clostridium perfringens]|nr:hypothetical protein [Clostridium perfringens]
MNNLMNLDEDLTEVINELKILINRYDLKDSELSSVNVSKATISKFLSCKRNISIKRLIYIIEKLLNLNVSKAECELLLTTYLNCIRGKSIPKIRVLME